MTAFRLELRRDRSILFWLVVVLLVYGGIMGAMYPILQDNDRLIQDYMKVFPKEFMAAFGMTGSLSDPGIFFTTYVGSWLWPIVAGIGGIIVGTRGVAVDLERGFLDLPLATPISRVRYLAASIGGQVVLMAVLAVSAVAGVLVVGIAVGAGFDPARFLMAAPLAFAFGCAIAAVTTLLAVITLSRGVAGGVAGGLLIGMYLVNVISQINRDLDWLSTFTAFSYFDPTPIIDEGAFPFGDLALFAIAAGAAWGTALWAFRRRDLAV